MVTAARGMDDEASVNGPRDDWARTWKWPGNTQFFNERYEAGASPNGLTYSSDIDGPFCGSDHAGAQSWEEFESAGPPADIRMPPEIADEIRAHLVARRKGMPRSDAPPPLPAGPDALRESSYAAFLAEEARRDQQARADALAWVPDQGTRRFVRDAKGALHEFSSVSELRDRLLASCPDGQPTYGPSIGGGDTMAPDWGWAVDLVRSSEWIPALGIALQHAATDGGELAQIALAELLGHLSASTALLPWTTPMAELWPDRRTSYSPPTGWGGADHTLRTIVLDQASHVAAHRAARTAGEALLYGYGANGGGVVARLASESGLRDALAATARAGRFPDGGAKGPWSWLAHELRIDEERGAALRSALVRIASSVGEAGADDPIVYALLDWFYDGQDLSWFAGVLDGWLVRPPSWWNTVLSAPRGWERSLRIAREGPHLRKLGDVAMRAHQAARMEFATPPVIDLPRLYG